MVNDDPEYQVGGRCIPGRNWRDGGWTRGLLKGGEACIAGRNWRGVGGRGGGCIPGRNWMGGEGEGEGNVYQVETRGVLVGQGGYLKREGGGIYTR